MEITRKRKCTFALIFFFAVLACLQSSKVAGQLPVSIVVDYVVDGDSLVVRRSGKAMEVRLWGIDAPEYDQPDSVPAKNALKRMAVGQEGALYIKYRDRYGRYVSLLKIDDLNVNEEMVAAGHCWVYIRYCREPVCKKWEDLQEEAKKKRRGLWNGNNPVPPWQWKARR